MRRIATSCFVLSLFACGDRGGGGGMDGGTGEGGDASLLSDAEVADRALELLAGWSGARVEANAPCPMENPVGDEFFHVLGHAFPSHVMSNAPIEFPLTSSHGPGPMQIGGVVACVEGASGFIAIDQPEVEGMPMMDEPILLAVYGQTGSDDDILGQQLAVSLGVLNASGQAGLYATTLAQICGQDGEGCDQPCDDPIAPGSAQVELGSAVCGADGAVDEDGAFAMLGRTAADLLQEIDDVPVASCVRVDFPGAPAAHTVRVVASWARQDACSTDACADESCGTGHGYGVFTSDDGTTFAFRGVAQGSGTTTIAPADPTVPDLPLVGEHFLVDDTVAAVLVCRLAYDEEADGVAVDHVEICP